MTAFEQAWALLKSIDAIKDPNNAAMKNNSDYYYNNVLEKWMYSPLETRDDDEEYWHHRIQTDYAPDNDMSSIHGMAKDDYWNMVDAMQNLTEEDFRNPNNEVLISNPNYYWDDFSKSWFPSGQVKSSNQRPPVRDNLRFDKQTMLPIEGAAGFDIDAFRSGKLPTPLEERVADRPPVSHIEWNPNINTYTLRGTGDEALSTLKPGMPMGTSPFPEGDMPLHNILGETPKQFRRKDYYRKLLTGLLNAGIDIDSDDRNRESNPFHQKFLDNLPPNLEAINNSDASGKIGYFDPIHYRRKPILKPTSEIYEKLGKTKRMRAKNKPEIDIALSDLARRDYGAIPIRSLPIEHVRKPIGSYQSRLGDFQE